MLEKNIFTSQGVRLSEVDTRGEVGHTFLYIIKNDLHEQPYGLMEDVFVEPETRGEGLGSDLVEAVKAEAKARGCYKLIGTCRDSKPEVQKMYERHGFTRHGTEFRIDF